MAESVLVVGFKVQRPYWMLHEPVQPSPEHALMLAAEQVPGFEAPTIEHHESHWTAWATVPDVWRLIDAQKVLRPFRARAGQVPEVDCIHDGVKSTRVIMPPRVRSDRYWLERELPPVPSARLVAWLWRIGRGWRPGRRIRGMGYAMAAPYFGVHVREYIDVLSPAVSAAIRADRRAA